MSSAKSFGKNLLKTLVMIFCLLAISVAMVACNEEPKLKMIKVDTTASTLTVEQGGTIDDLNIVVKGYYEDGKTISIDVDDKALTFSELNTSQAGDVPLTVSYTFGEGENKQTLTDTVNITVTKKAKSIAFATNSGLPQYVEEGQTVDYSNLKLVVTYLDDTTQEVSYNADLMQVTLNTETEGKIKVVVAYKGVEQTISKDVMIKSVVSIEEVVITPKFYQYQPASFDGSTIKVKYSTDEEETINFNSRVLISGFDITKSGDQEITITYSGKQAQTTVNVVALDSIEYKNGLNLNLHVGVDAYNGKYTIRKGTQLNPTELVIVAKYVIGKDGDDNIYKTFDVAKKSNRDIQVSELNTDAENTDASLTITYNQKTAVLPVVVTEIKNIVCEAATAYQYQPITNKNVLVKAYDTIGDIFDVSEGVKLTLDTSVAQNRTLHVVYTENKGTNLEYSKETDYTVSVIGVKTGESIESIKYESGLPKKVVQGSTFVYSGLRITVLYNDAENVEDCNSFSLKYDENFMDVADATTDTVGSHTLTITLHLNDTDFVQTNYTYQVVEQIEQDAIIAFEDPEFVTNYTKTIAKNTYTSTGSSGIKGFEITNNPYLVGAQNAWFYKPKAHTENSDENGLEKYATEVKVYLDGSSTALTPDVLATYVNIDTLETQSYQFSQDAIGHTFKIEVSPVDQAEEFVSTFTFNVVDGYNVYNARELSVFDNTNDDNKWTELKAQWGIDLNTKVNSIILQNNISITKDVVPARFFWTRAELGGRDEAEVQAMEGSFKDNDSNNLGYIYKRIQPGDSTFKFEGNYYKVSADKLPLIVEDDGHNSTYRKNPITVHSTIFGFYGDDTAQNPTQYEINNVEFYGNTQKSEAAVDSGGIICFKKKDCKMTVNNILSQRWFISLFQREGRDASSVEAGDQMSEKYAFVLNNVNAYDAYNTLLYNWGGKVYINNCHMIGAGGPVMICDQTSHGNSPETTGTISNVNVNNSVLESWVAGSEGWFTAYAGASVLATSMKSLDKLFAAFAGQTGGAINKTFLDSAMQKMNLIAVYKSGSEAGLTTVNIRGKFTDVTMDGDTPRYTNGLDLPLLTKIRAYFVEKTILDNYKKANSLPEDYAFTAEQKAAILAGVNAETKAYVESEVNKNFKDAVVVQTYNGVMIIPTDDPMIFAETENGIELVDFATVSAQLAAAYGYLNVYIYNGMGAVLSLDNSTIDLQDRLKAWGLA